MTRGVEAESDRGDEWLALLALCDGERWAIIEALVRRVLAVQETADEAEVLAMIAYVEALLLGDGQPPH